MNEFNQIIHYLEDQKLYSNSDFDFDSRSFLSFNFFPYDGIFSSKFANVFSSLKISLKYTFTKATRACNLLFKIN